MVKPSPDQFSTSRPMSGTAKIVVKYTNTIDTTSEMPHRRGIAAAFGMCAGLAFPPVARMKGGN